MKKEEVLKEFRQKFASAYLIADEAVIDTFLRAVESWWLLKLSENTAELKKKIEIMHAEAMSEIEMYATTGHGNKDISTGKCLVLQKLLSELNHQ